MANDLWAELIAHVRAKRYQRFPTEERRWRRRCPQCALPVHSGVCTLAPWRWTA